MLAETSEGRREGTYPAGEGQALPGQTQHSTAGLKALAPFPLSLAPLVHNDKTKTSQNFVTERVECL